MTQQQPWSLRQLQDALRRAGWQRIDGPGSCYQHPGGKRWELYNWSPQHGRVSWHVWAERREVPRPEEV